MPRLTARVTRLEWYRSGGPTVAKIVSMIERADDERLHCLNETGELVRMAQRLGDRQLDRLIDELQQMLIKEGGQNGSLSLC